MAGELDGRVALVTGGSRGIGRAICESLGRSGAAVAVNYRRGFEAASEVQSQIEAGGGRAMTVGADVGDKQSTVEMCAEVADSLGPIDLLVNNAGIMTSGSLLEHREEDLDAMWRTNVKGVINCTQAVAPTMIEKGWGRVVNVASNSGLGTALPGTTLYATTKGAVLTLTRRLAFELGKHGITVNAVLPGYIRTDMTLGGLDDEQAQVVRDRLDSRSMVGRGVAEPDEIARIVSFLAADDSRFMTGQLLVADGGRMDYLSHA